MFFIILFPLKHTVVAQCNVPLYQGGRSNKTQFMCHDGRFYFIKVASLKQAVSMQCISPLGHRGWQRVDFSKSVKRVRVVGIVCIVCFLFLSQL